MLDRASNITTTVQLSRRKLLAATSSIGALALAPKVSALAAAGDADQRDLPPYGNGTLPAGVRARLVPNVNGLTVNMLEAGFETPGRPLVLLLHGFPNLAYSWRKVMPASAAAGYYAVAPDCRGFGRTAGWDNSWDADPQPFLALNLLRDQIALVSALGYRTTAMMVGHDQGSLMAGAWRADPARHVSPPHAHRRRFRRAAHRSRSTRRTARPRRTPSSPTPSSTRSMPNSIRRGEVIRITGRAPRPIADMKHVARVPGT